MTFNRAQSSSIAIVKRWH